MGSVARGKFGKSRCDRFLPMAGVGNRPESVDPVSAKEFALLLLCCCDMCSLWLKGNCARGGGKLLGLLAVLKFHKWSEL